MTAILMVAFNESGGESATARELRGVHYSLG